MNTLPNQPFITSEDFAALVHKHPRTLNNILTSRKARYNRSRTQLPPFKRVAGRFVVSLPDLEKWLAEQPVANTANAK